MNEQDLARFKEIERRHSRISTYPWENRGTTAAHANPGGDVAIAGGKYEGMGERENIALVTHELDADFILNAPKDIEWLLNKLARSSIREM